MNSTENIANIASRTAQTPATRTFHQLLVNTLIANVTGAFLWFALTFWTYLETRSVMATSIVSGLYMLLSSLTGTVFGAIVDAHRKKVCMVAATVVTLTAYVLAAGLYAVTPDDVITDWSRPTFWAFAGLVLLGGVVGGLRSIALSTTVTLLVPADRRDKANGLVGSVNGVAHVTTSIFSGLAIGFLGMGGTIAVAVVLSTLSLAHLLPIRIAETRPERSQGRQRMEFGGAWSAVRAVPGLRSLIAFSTFNNFVMGVFMALLDPYGLTLFSVQGWGLVLGVTGVGFIVGGVVLAKVGVGRNAVRTLMFGNLAISAIGTVFAIRESQLLLIVGMFAFMLVIPVIEGAEQTIYQRVVPFEKLGRVMGLARSIQAASTPVSAFIIGPLAQLALIPFMASSSGQERFGWLLGDGAGRGMALAFVIASTITLVTVTAAFSSAAYRRLSAAYAGHSPSAAPLASADVVDLTTESADATGEPGLVTA